MTYKKFQKISKKTNFQSHVWYKMSKTLYFIQFLFKNSIYNTSRMSQRRLETFPDLPRPLGTSRTSYKKSYVLVKRVTFLLKKTKKSTKKDHIFIKNYIKEFYNIQIHTLQKMRQKICYIIAPRRASEVLRVPSYERLKVRKSCEK